jgi:hypothetical protein
MMDITNNLRLRIHTSNNDTFVAYVDDSHQKYDDIGALYYVVAVVLIYGLSIVMMIASHIRKNKQVHRTGDTQTYGGYTDRRGTHRQTGDTHTDMGHTYRQGIHIQTGDT